VIYIFIINSVVILHASLANVHYLKSEMTITLFSHILSCHVFLVTWLIIIASGLGEAVY
jgi:hypothetical protein